MPTDIQENARQLEAIREKRRKLRNAAISSGLLFLLVLLLPWTVILGVLKMDPENVPRWIIAVIILVGFGVLFPCIFVFTFWGTVDNYFLRRRLKRNGQPMRGTITNVHSTGVRINHVPVVRLTARLDTGETTQAEITTSQPYSLGSTVLFLVDPENHARSIVQLIAQQ